MKDKLIKAYDYALENDSFSKVSIVKQAKKVCVYGLGKYFEDAFIRQNIGKRFEVTYLCDSNKNKLEELSQDERYREYIFILPDELDEDTAVIFMLGDPRNAMDKIAPLVGKGNCITYNDLILDDIMDAEKSRVFYENQKENIVNAFDMLEDEESKKVFYNIFCLRVAPHLADYSYEDLCIEPQYFPSGIMKLSANEVVADCGAYNGDTLDVFYNITGGCYDKYYAFEMDEENCTALIKNVSDQRYKNVSCCKLGVWDETKRISYGKMSSSDSYSIFNGSEICHADVIKLDDFFIEKEKCTLIKMDIEGAEMNALKGAYEIIKNDKPKMAICVYHRVEDLWQIPIYLKSVNNDYKMYIRHHAKYWVSETVCYAV